MIDEDRLFRNALSSMPLVFNLFGPMVIDPRLATAVFRRLLPTFVHSVESIHFEHSPGRFDDRFLMDGTAFDVALRVVTPEGESGTVFIELKYSEDMTGPAARPRPRYDEASRQVGLFKDPDSQLLRSLVLEQLWREHMLAQLAVDHGITSRAIFIAIGPRLNRRVNAAFRVYQSELADVEQSLSNRVAFDSLHLETVIEALRKAGASEIATALWQRYCDFDRIYRMSLQGFPGAADLVGPYSSSPPSDGRPKSIGTLLKLTASRSKARSRTNPASSNSND